jgi:hypothetical protein
MATTGTTRAAIRNNGDEDTGNTGATTRTQKSNEHECGTARGVLVIKLWTVVGDDIGPFNNDNHKQDAGESTQLEDTTTNKQNLKEGTKG